MGAALRATMRLMALVVGSVLASMAAGALVAQLIPGTGMNSLSGGALAAMSAAVGVLLWRIVAKRSRRGLENTLRSTASLNPAARRQLYTAHSVVGAVLGSLLCIVFFSGSLTVYRDELRLWLAPNGTRLAAHSASGPLARPAFHYPGLDRAVAEIHRQFPATPRMAVRLPQGAQTSLEMLVPRGRARGLARIHFDAYSGESLGESQSQLADFLFNLHANLTLPRKWGRYVLGLCGVAWLLLLLSGPLLNRHVLRDLMVIRWQRSRRTVLADLHRAMGAWGLGFYFCMAASGALLGLKDFWLLAPAVSLHGSVSAARTALRPPQLPSAHIHAPMHSASQLLVHAAETVSDFEPRFMSFTHWGDRNARVAVGGAVRGALLPKNEGVRVQYEAATGTQLELVRGDNTAFFDRVFRTAAPLHYGDFGDSWLKALYFCWGLIATGLSLSGTALWVEARRPRDNSD